MDEASNLDFLSAFGQEFCGALCPPVPFELIVPQDAYEVWLRAFDSDPSPSALAALKDFDLEELRTASATYFECPSVTVAMVRLAISRTLARWPTET